jgi:hypothetical protein
MSMSPSIAEANEMLRQAVEIRRENQAAGKPHEEWYGVSQAATEHMGIDTSDDEMKRLRGDGLTREQPEKNEYSEWVPPSYAVGQTLPAEQLLLDALAVIRDRRPKYGGPLQHFRRTVGMINSAFADVLRRPLTEADWAIFMTLDKVARYCGPNKTADGPIDLAGYAACLAEVEAADG